MSSIATIRARIGAHSKWAATADRSAATAPARMAALRALDARLAQQFGIDAAAPGAEIRLKHARTAHFASLALASAQARRKVASR